MINRRRFLKYAVAGVAAGAAGLSAAVCYLGEKSRPTETMTTTYTSTSQTTQTSYSPPTIAGLSYTPTRVINDKVYDLRVDVDVSNPGRQLSSVQLSIIPVVYGHLPSEAFPKEEPKAIMLQPTGLEKEALSTDFRDLRGGREYDLKAVATDPKGGMNERTLRTEYIREFENIASKNSIIAAATIVPYEELFRGQWWYPTWHTPILNKYSLSDPVAVSKQIDHATGYGSINCFFIDTQWGETYSEIDKMVSNPLFFDSGIRFAMLYNSINSRSFKKANGWEIDLSNSENVNGLKSDFQILARLFFTRKNYLRVAGKPLVYLYYSHGYVGRVNDAIDSLRQFLDDNFGLSVYLFSDVIERFHPLHPLHTTSSRELRKLAEPYDGVTLWGGGFSGQPEFLGENYEDQLEKLYSLGSEIAKSNGKGFMPSFKNGENTTLLPWGSKFTLPRSPELFRKRLEISLKHIKDYPDFEILRIDTLDDWYEDNVIAWSKEEGPAFFETLKQKISEF